MHSWKSLLLLGVLMISALGCGPKKPEGIPDLYPATVTITDSGSPITNANIFFLQQESTTGSWTTNGLTDAKGVAVIKTSLGDWKSNGAPAGKYKIYVTKVPDAPMEAPPPEIANDSDALDAFYRAQAKKIDALPKEIPVKLSSPMTSPLNITVEAGSTAELTVDVSQYK